jgi:hypothetical protein
MFSPLKVHCQFCEIFNLKVRSSRRGICDEKIGKKEMIQNWNKQTKFKQKIIPLNLNSSDNRVIINES